MEKFFEKLMFVLLIAVTLPFVVVLWVAAHHLWVLEFIK